ncbi:DUF2207 domain-containing protein, partial [Acetobacterium fimetarium]
MKKRCTLLLLGLLLAGCIFPGSTFAQEYFDITQYDVTMNVQENHAYDIQENISVTFSEARHGIYRYIPYTGDFYRQINGQPVDTPYSARLTNVKVTGYKYETSTENDSVVVQIGDANTTVSGNQTYPISYVWDPGDDKIDSMDDVYYNIIGTNWDTSIAGAHFKIVMPKAFDASQVEFITGSYGSTDTTSVDFTVNGNTIEGTLNRPLTNNEGVTLKVNLPQGYFVGAFTGHEFDPLMYAMFILSILAAALIWFFTGRDEKPVEPVEFYPPHGFTPSQVGFIVDGDLDKPEVISLLMYWADKGYMTIEQVDKKKFIFHKVKNLPDTAEDFEQTFFVNLFDQKDSFSTASVPTSFYDTIVATKSQIKSYFDLPENKLFTKSSMVGFGFITLIMCFPLLALVINGAYASNMLTGFWDGLIMIGFAALFAMVPTIISVNMITTALRNRLGTSTRKTTGRLIAGIILTIVFALIAMIASMLLGFESIVPVLLALLATYATAVFQIVAEKRTETGRQWLGEVLGFKNFIEKAEKDRILALVNENPQYFYNILPYAYVLGITDKWAKNFESIAIEQPSWYYGHTYGDPFTSVVFAGALMHSMNSISTNIIVPPKSGSGGFGGGGFSG